MAVHDQWIENPYYSYNELYEDEEKFFQEEEEGYIDSLTLEELLEWKEMMRADSFCTLPVNDVNIKLYINEKDGRWLYV